MNSMTRAWLVAWALAACAGLAWAQPCTPPAHQHAYPRDTCDSVLVSLLSFDRRPTVQYRLW